LDPIKGKSVARVEKERTLGLLAYNRSNQVRRLAAAHLQLPPRRLSVAGTWSLRQGFLAGVREGPAAAAAEAEFERLLRGGGSAEAAQPPSRPQLSAGGHRATPQVPGAQTPQGRNGVELKCHWASPRSHEERTPSTAP